MSLNFLKKELIDFEFCIELALFEKKSLLLLLELRQPDDWNLKLTTEYGSSSFDLKHALQVLKLLFIDASVADVLI